MGDLELKNRAVMAALTRCRAGEDAVATDLHAEYYSSRASSGFILTECSPVSAQGNALLGCCGIYNDAQEEGWRKVVEAVHQKGGKIVLQIWHGGRAASANPEKGLVPISSSAIAIGNQTNKPRDVPKEATLEDIQMIIGQFRSSAERAKRAGFDGVQLHGAHGYLMDQFFRESCNKRTDQYGGSIENRIRLACQILDELIEVFGAKRVGMKLSLHNSFQDMEDSNPDGILEALIEKLNEKGVAFLEMNEGPYIRGSSDNSIANCKDLFCKKFKSTFKGIWISNHGYTLESANEHIQQGITDMVSFGWLYVANADLVEKFANGTPLNNCSYVEPKEMTGAYVYGKGEKGYTDLSVYAPQK